MRNTKNPEFLQVITDLAHTIREETGDRVQVTLYTGDILNDAGKTEEYAFLTLNRSLNLSVHADEDWERLKVLARQIVGLDNGKHSYTA